MTALLVDPTVSTLSDVLAKLGLEHRPASMPGRRHVMRGDELLLANVTAGGVWCWLRGEHEQPCPFAVILREARR